MLKNILFFSTIFVTIVLAGCSSPSKDYKTTKNKIPKIPKFVLPGDNSEKWRYLGTTEENQISSEIDSSSIKLDKNNIFVFNDRKTIINPNKFFYSKTTQTPYKFSIGYWAIDCTNKQYILTKITTYDTYGRSIKTFDYSNDNNIKWLAIGENTIANMQYNYICLKQNNNLGY